MRVKNQYDLLFLQILDDFHEARTMFLFSKNTFENAKENFNITFGLLDCLTTCGIDY